MTYEKLLETADQAGIIVKEKPLVENDGLIKGNRIAIRKDISTSIEKSCVLAEELGHHYTSSGNILNQSDVMNRKQELKARLWGYNLKIGLMGIVRSYEHGCRNMHEMAEYLDVTEEYLSDALNCYKNKFGHMTFIDNYAITFLPNLNVIRVIND